jgi:hypothetical protein
MIRGEPMTRARIRKTLTVEDCCMEVELVRALSEFASPPTRLGKFDALSAAAWRREGWKKYFAKRHDEFYICSNASDPKPEVVLRMKRNNVAGSLRQIPRNAAIVTLLRVEAPLEFENGKKRESDGNP